MEQLRTPTEKYHDTIWELARLLQSAAISQETFDRGVAAAVKSLKDATDTGSELASFMKVLDQVSVSVSSGFADASIAGESLGNMFTSLAEGVAKLVLQLTLLTAIKSAISGLGSFFSGSSGDFGFPGPQHGGSFTVGGAGGPDSQLVAFRASPGEQVMVTPLGQASGVVYIQVINNTGNQERRDPSGGRDNQIIVGEIVAEQLAQAGSASGRVLRATYGADQRLIGR